MKDGLKSRSSSLVMEQIKQGNIKMKPRLHFVLLFAASITGIFLSGIIIAYLLSIVIYWLRIQTADTMAWGARTNLENTIGSFPWLAIPVAIGLFLATVWLIRRQSTMYRLRLSTIALIFAGVSLVAGIGLSYLDIGSSHLRDQGRNQTQGQRGPGIHNFNR